MMLGIKIFLLGVATLYVTVQGKKAATERTDDIHYDTVTIEHDGPISRSKRSTEMPHTMFFNIKSQKTNVKLRLKRAPKLDIPTYFLKNGTVVRTYIPDYQKHGVYISYDTGRAVMVSEKGGYYDVEGDVMVNKENLQVTPIGRGRHSLFSAGPVNYGKDYRNGKNKYGLKPKISVRKAARRLRKSRRHRSKRQVTEYVIELLVVTDISVRNKFLARNGDLALADAELKTYYALIILGMTERYQSITEFYPDVSYIVEGSGIIIPDTINDVPFYRDNQNNGLVQFDQALDDFTDWVNLNRGTLPKHDHAMWFTNDRLAQGSSTSVIGVAWLNGVCRNLGTSMVEDFFSGGTTATATHELGHSLTAYHDGDFRECSNNDYYVMAAFSFIPLGAQKTNPWFFSYCSSVYIVYYTEQSHQCLSTDDNGIRTPSTSEVAGQYIDADEQCRLAFSSSSSYFCRNTQRTGIGFASICNRLYCYNPQSADCEYVGSFDFTSCGDGQWCEGGDCVESSSAPRTASNCPQGDSPVVSCNPPDCPMYNTSQLTDCCATCSSPVLVVSATIPPATSPTISPVTSPITSPVTPPTTSPVTSPTTSPVTSPTISPVTSPTTSPITSPTISPVTSPTTSPVTSPTTSSVTSPTTSPVTSPTTSQVNSPTTSPVTSPTMSPVTSPTISPTIPPPLISTATSPTTSPVTSPITSPVASPTTSPVTSPVTSPTNSPTTASVTSPATSPTNSPTTAPVTSPAISPTNSPTTAPVTSPAISPTNSPTTAPVTSPAKSPTNSPTTSATQAPVVCSGLCRWCRRNSIRLTIFRFCSPFA